MRRRRGGEGGLRGEEMPPQGDCLQNSGRDESLDRRLTVMSLMTVRSLTQPSVKVTSPNFFFSPLRAKRLQTQQHSLILEYIIEK